MKSDFPIFKKNKNLVYLDSAATSQKPQSVITAINDFYKNYNSNVHRGLYKLAEKATKEVDEIRKKTAAFINAKSEEEIIFVRNTTEAVNLVAYSWGRENVGKGDVVLATITEHHSNFVPWQALAKEKNAKFDILDIDNNSELQINNSKKQFKKAKILAITHVSNVLGIINPLEKIIKDIKKINPKILVLVDAAQAAPHIKIDVQKLNCDFLVFSGHKMLAETGIGVLYGKKELLQKMQPFLYGGEMIREVTLESTSFSELPSKFEAGTLNISGIISLGAAIDYLKKIGMDNIQKYEEDLTAYCLKKMREINGITIYGPDKEKNKIGVIAFNIDNLHPHDTAQILSDLNICVRAGHHCAMPLHKKFGVLGSVRASFYIYNDKKDVDRLIEGISRAKKLFNL